MPYLLTETQVLQLIKENLAHTKLSEMAAVYSLITRTPSGKCSGTRKSNNNFMDLLYNKNLFRKH